MRIIPILFMVDFINASFKNWGLVSAEVNVNNDIAVVVFKIVLEDGLDGFPETEK